MEQVKESTKKPRAKKVSESISEIPELEVLQAELCKRNFYEFIKEFWSEIIPDKFVDNWHIKYLADELQEIGIRLFKRMKKENDLIVNIPPATSKSTILSIMFPCWLWVLDPTIRIICVSYSAGLSLDQSTKSRSILQSDKFKKLYPDIKIKEDANIKSNFQTTKGGGRISTSTLATITGQHAHIIICDDVSNVTQANSETERNVINDWVSTTLSTRKTDHEVAVSIYCQQRLHPQDLTGYLLSKGKNYKHICLPAELNKSLQPKELDSNYINGLLDPVRLSPERLHELKIDLGSKAYNTQILQTPQSDEDSIIKESWLKIITVEEYKIITADNIPTIQFYLDTAYTSDAGNDPSAILACTKIGELLYILNISQVWMEFPKLVSHIKYFTVENGYNSKSRIVIEPKASGKSIVQYLKTQTSLNVIEGVSPTGTKIERLNAISPKVEAGKVILVHGKWNNLFLSECTANNPLHDDVRDTFVMAVQEQLIKSKGQGKYNISFVKL